MVFSHTVKILKIWTPEEFAVINLKFEEGCFTIKDADGMANSRSRSDLEQSDLGLLCLPRPSVQKLVGFKLTWIP